MGCFSTPRCEERGSPSVSRYSTGMRIVSRDSTSLLSNKPVELPDPRVIEGGQKVVGSGGVGTTTRWRAGGDVEVPARMGGRTAFSGPLVGYNAVEGESRASTTNYFSADDGKKVVGWRTLRRATSFGGRPQPLPLPAGEEQPPLSRRTKELLLPEPEVGAVTTSRPAALPSSTQTRTFKLDEPPTDSWSSRRGRVASAGGLPLPSPPVATKSLPNLVAFEFREIQLATNDFAESFCLERGPSGAVFSARLKDTADDFDSDIDTAVLRLPENAAQAFSEWKADVQVLSQLSNPNLCAVKGYCTQERSSNNREKRTQPERLLVFEQLSNGTLHDHLFGSRCTSNLDWTTRIDIALGAARGLLYIHDRAPLQIVYKEFNAAHVLLDEEYLPKLAGYGLSVTPLSANRIRNVTRSPAHAKRNVWSFGILLLELLTGKSSREAIYAGDDNSFLQWGKQFCRDEAKLPFIIDPRMKSVCPVTGAMEVVTLLLQCVSKKDSAPSMCEVVAALKVIKAKHCSDSPSTGLRGKKGLPKWVLSPKRQSRHKHSYSDLQTSSDASSSSETEDVFVSSKVSPRGALRTVVV